MSMSFLQIEKERVEDQRAVEAMVREAFWDTYSPGASEHAILHFFRERPDFIKDLNLILKKEEEVIGQIMYATVSTQDPQLQAVSFGPVCIKKKLQGLGLGEQLIRYSLEKAKDFGFDLVFITGSYAYYEQFGFVPASGLGYFLNGERAGDFFMVKELTPGALGRGQGTVSFSPGYDLSPAQVETFDQNFQRASKTSDALSPSSYV